MQFALFAALLSIVILAIFLLRRSSQRGTPEATRELLGRRARWTAQNRIPVGLTLGGALIALTGAAMGIHAMFGETRDVDLARLEAGESTDATFMRVHGFAHGAFAACRETRGVQTCHTPVTATPNGTTTAVLVSSSVPRDGELDFVGMALGSDDTWSLDGVRTAGLTPTRSAFVLVSGETPEERRPMGLVMFLIGAVVSTVGALWVRRNPWPR
jgi:hypothetical protein